MNLSEYRASDREVLRTNDLMRVIQNIKKTHHHALDVGARDGHFSRLFAQHFDRVTAIDLEKPSFTCENVTCLKGDVTNLEFRDDEFDFVFCAEVLEHIPTNLLDRACDELSRVANKYLLIGVPYKQDIRVSRTTCYSCGKPNPPWGHVNRFDRKRLEKLFSDFDVIEVSYVGNDSSATNFISAMLMDMAGNPYGSYEQEEPCIHCGKKLIPPPQRNLLQKLFTKASFLVGKMQSPFTRQHPNWIHILFQKRG